jgi:Holliday junction resolvase RusA-like endonuclease
VIEFTIPGKPKAWQRATTVVNPRNGRLMKLTPKDMRTDQAVVAQLARLQMRTRPLLGGPLKLEVLCVYAIPPSWPKAKQLAAKEGLVWKTSTPDADNLLKLVGDALNGVAWRDDAQVVQMTGAKRYGSPERTEVRITPLDRFCDHSQNAAFRAWAAERSALASTQPSLALACNTASREGP